MFEQGHGAGAVAELVLLGRRQFGAGAVALGDPEQRVVAEALGAAGLMQNAAVPEAFAKDRQRVGGMPHQRQGADELGAALAVRHRFKHVQQLGIVGGIALAVGIASRVDARRATEGVYRQSRVVGQRWQAGHLRGVAGLENGILDKRQAGFFRLNAAELADGAHFDVRAEHRLQFFQLAGVVAGQHQFSDRLHSSGKNSWLKSKLWGTPSAAVTFRVKRRVSRCSKGNWAR